MGQLGFKEGVNLLNKYGITLLPSVIIQSKNQLAQFAEKAKYPIVLKVYSPEVIHKYKAGFVKTNIQTKFDLLKSYDNIVKNIKKLKIMNYHIIVQNKIFGNELIIGAKFDETFGYVIIFGLGGIYTEALNKVVMRICPINDKQARGLVSAISDILHISKASKEKLAKLIMKLSKLINKEKINELDLNPVIVNENGINIVDVRIIK